MLNLEIVTPIRNKPKSDRNLFCFKKVTCIYSSPF